MLYLKPKAFQLWLFTAQLWVVTSAIDSPVGKLWTMAGREAGNSTWFTCQFLFTNECITMQAEHREGPGWGLMSERVLCQPSQLGFCCPHRQPSPAQPSPAQPSPGPEPGMMGRSPSPIAGWDLESHLFFSKYAVSICVSASYWMMSHICRCEGSFI